MSSIKAKQNLTREEKNLIQSNFNPFKSYRTIMYLGEIVRDNIIYTTNGTKIGPQWYESWIDFERISSLNELLNYCLIPLHISPIYFIEETVMLEFETIKLSVDDIIWLQVLEHLSRPIHNSERICTQIVPRINLI